MPPFPLLLEERVGPQHRHCYRLHDANESHDSQEKPFATKPTGITNTTLILVGKAYTAMLKVNVGDALEIKLGRKPLRLVPRGGSDEDA